MSDPFGEDSDPVLDEPSNAPDHRENLSSSAGVDGSPGPGSYPKGAFGSSSLDQTPPEISYQADSRAACRTVPTETSPPDDAAVVDATAATDDWEADDAEFDRPAVCSAVAVTGPASRVAFDALVALYEQRGRTALEAATTKACRSVVESVVAPLANMSSARFGGHAVTPPRQRSPLPAPTDHASASAFAQQPGDDAGGIRERHLKVRHLTRNRFARVVVERHCRTRGGSSAAKVLASLDDASLGRAEVRLLQASPPTNFHAAISWGTSVDAKTRYLLGEMPLGGVHVVAASLDHLQVRLRAQRARYCAGESVHGPHSLQAFNAWYADIDAALSAAYAHNPSRAGTVILLTQTEGESAMMSGDEMQRLLGRLHETVNARESQRASFAFSCNESDDDPSRGVHHRPSPPTVVALVILQVEFGSRSLRGAACGEVAVAGAKVLCSAVDAVGGPLATSGMDLSRDLRGGALGSHGIELVRTGDDLVELLDALVLDHAFTSTSAAASGSAACVVRGGILALAAAAQARHRNNGNGADTTRIPLTLAPSELQDMLDKAEVSHDPAARGAVVRLLARWGVIVLPPAVAGLPDEDIGQMPESAIVCVRPETLHGIVGEFISAYYEHATTTLVENTATSARLSQSTFTAHDVRRWLSEHMTRHVYRDWDLTDHDVSLLVGILAAHHVIAEVGSGTDATRSTSDHHSGDDVVFFAPGASPARSPAALPHLFAWLSLLGDAISASPRNAAPTSPDVLLRHVVPAPTVAVRWIAVNTEPSLVVSALAASYGPATRRGPARHVLVWRDAMVLGVDHGHDADPVLPQRTLVASVPRRRDGDAPGAASGYQQLLLIATVAPRTGAPALESSSTSMESVETVGDAASEMFDSILATLASTQASLLPGLRFEEGFPCPRCLSRHIPSIDAGWAAGLQIATGAALSAAGNVPPPSTSPVRDGRRDSLFDDDAAEAPLPASASTMGGFDGDAHFFTRAFRDYVVSAADAQAQQRRSPGNARDSNIGTSSSGGTPPRSATVSRCLVCGEEVNMRTVASRAAKVLHGTTTNVGGDSDGDGSLPPFIPHGAESLYHGLLSTLRLDDGDDVVAQLKLFTHSFDSLVWTLTKFAALLGGSDLKPSTAAPQPAATRSQQLQQDSLDDRPPTGGYHRQPQQDHDAAGHQRNEAKPDEDDWDVV